MARRSSRRQQSHGQGRGRGTDSGAWARNPPGPQLKLKITNYPPAADTTLLHRYFSQFGSIDFIRIDTQTEQAFLAFNPPPTDLVKFSRTIHALFDSDTNRARPLLITQLGSNHASVPSPLGSQWALPAHLTLQPYHLRVGVMIDENALLALRAVQAVATHPIVIKSHLKDAPELKIEFPALRHGIWQTIELRTNFSNIATVRKATGPGGTDIMSLTFQHPPRIFAIQSDSLFGPDDTHQWSKNSHFRRITDLEIDELRRDQSYTTSYRSSDDVFIDPGRWLSWAFTFKHTPLNDFALPRLLDIFNAYNIDITSGHLSTKPPRKETVIWRTFDLDNHLKLAHLRTSAIQTLQASSVGFPVLTFDTRYVMEVCFSKGLLFEGRITFEFLQRIAEDETGGRMLLENLALANKKLYNSMQIFELPELRQSRKRRVPSACILMHSVTVTPTTMYVHPVQVEVSNRVIRKFNDLSHRFLRVRFGDEAYFGKLQSHNGSDDELFERVRRTLVNGIRVAGRHYTFLASGNSQFRENGAYFFSNTESVTVNSIRQWMGYFQHIREIPKYASRIGQCFATTRAVTSIGMTPDITVIPDIQRNGFNFTDGVGKISPFLARMISQELRLGPVPSLFQFRMGGCKGVLAVDPQLSGRAVHIRPSQKKFDTDYNQLEVIRWSSFASAYLNRQIILVLSSLGIPDVVFVKKIKTQLEEINVALEHDGTAINMLLANVDFNQATLSIAKMLRAGMRHDPFVDSMLHLWRAWMKKSLKEKTNMFIPQGAFLLGCVDETATLRMDENDLPEIFLQIPDLTTDGKYKVVEGTCIIARNPALHPGDIRVVRAVDCIDLHHLKDVVVLPQLGAQDLANMCSGGDLDGDDFLIIWDPDLIPPEQNVEPMDYSPPAPILSKGPVTQSDIIKFFCNYMKNDSLGTIAVAHRAWADWFDEGVKHETCIELAQLHSQAVDYCKTGVPAQITRKLRVEKYPHWHEKPLHQSYKSTKVLGKLYDEIDRVDFQPNYGACTFDERILNAYDLPAAILEQAYALKIDYDIDMRRIMAQFGIQTEFEVWSAFVMTHSREIKAYKFAEEIGQLMLAHTHQYRDVISSQLGIKPHDREYLDKLGPFVAAMYKITAAAVGAHREREKDSATVTNTPPPMISFPWIFRDELLGIARMADLKSSLSEAMIQNTKNWQNPGNVVNDRASSLRNRHADGADGRTTAVHSTDGDRTSAADDSQDQKAISPSSLLITVANLPNPSNLECHPTASTSVTIQHLRSPRAGPVSFDNPKAGQPIDDMIVFDDEDEEQDVSPLSVAQQISAANAFRQLASLLGGRRGFAGEPDNRSPTMA